MPILMKPCPQSSPWRLLGLVLLFAHAGALTGCAHTAVTSAKPATTVLQPLAMPEETKPRSLRVIVQFKTGVAFNSESLLKELSQQAGASVRYMASVSQDTHVYAIQVHPYQEPNSVLSSLSALPAVARVEQDNLVQKNGNRR